MHNNNQPGRLEPGPREATERWKRIARSQPARARWRRFWSPLKPCRRPDGWNFQPYQSYLQCKFEFVDGHHQHAEQVANKTLLLACDEFMHVGNPPYMPTLLSEFPEAGNQHIIQGGLLNSSTPNCLVKHMKTTKIKQWRSTMTILNEEPSWTSFATVGMRAGSSLYVCSPKISILFEANLFKWQMHTAARARTLNMNREERPSRRALNNTQNAEHVPSVFDLIQCATLYFQCRLTLLLLINYADARTLMNSVHSSQCTLRQQINMALFKYCTIPDGIVNVGMTAAYVSTAYRITNRQKKNPLEMRADKWPLVIE